MSHVAFLVSIAFYGSNGPTEQTDGADQRKSDSHRGWRGRFRS